MSPEELDEARWLRADKTHPSNYACAGIEAARLARVGWMPGASWEDEATALFEDIRRHFRGCSPGSEAEKLWMRINILLEDAR